MGVVHLVHHRDDQRDMATPQFTAAFETYLRDAVEARDHGERGRHHDHRRQLFVEFLRSAFNVDVADVVIEEHVRGARVRGFIDLLYSFLVFEFKRDLEEERGVGLRELTTYLGAVDAKRPIGVLTDGLRFEVYVREADQLSLVDQADLTALAANPDSAYLWFDSYLFSARDFAPTPADIVRRFGSNSPVFLAARGSLREMYAETREHTDVQVKYGEWDRLLAKVYGESVGAESLFLTHTYLALLSRLIAYVATQHHGPRAADLLRVVDGGAFARLATNLAEADFFAWVLAPELADRTRALLAGMTAHLGRYDLTLLGDMDLLQRLYQDLIDPADRHDLGEFYTPDWLAELTLREAGWPQQDSLLDPSCGSGTFLFTALRLLSETGLDPHDLSRWALDHICGLDVHPVAVLIAKVNYLLALQRFGGLATYPGPITIPVYMADALMSAQARTGLASIPVSDQDRFHISEDMAAAPGFDAAVDTLVSYASLTNVAVADADTGWLSWLRDHGHAPYIPIWAENLRLLRTLIAERRDTVWAFILKNAYRPFYFARRRFGFVVGNPPWLSYRYIRSGPYRDQVRQLVHGYGLAARTGEQHLVTQIELATLFYLHAQRRYLTPEGTIAFVMPRSVLTGALQHRRFRQLGSFSRVLDLKDVDVPTESSLKVFGVDSCVLIRTAGPPPAEPPVVVLTGELPNKGLPYDRAMELLQRTDSTYRPPAEAADSPYLSRVLQGATLVPRGLWFAVPASAAVDPDTPRLMTDPSVLERAQEGWTAVRVESEVETRFLYADLLSNDMVPFGGRHLSLVVVPLYAPTPTHPALLTSAAAYAAGFPHLGEWLSQAERQWAEHRSGATAMPLSESLDYMGKLTDQDPRAHFRVLCGTGGSHVTACVVDLSAGPPSCHGLATQGQVAGHTTHWLGCATADEAHYLAAVLNAPCVDDAITPHQTRGAFHGGRHVSRRPFQVLPTPIPLYDPVSEQHRALAELSQRCHELVRGLDLPLDAEIGRLRQRVRATLREPLAEIEVIVQGMLNLGGTP
jgi:hypothetical protein